MEQIEETRRYLSELKPTNHKLEWMIEFYPDIDKTMKNHLSLKEIFEALNKKQLIDKSFTYSIFKNYFYSIKNKTEDKQKKNQNKKEKKPIATKVKKIINPATEQINNKTVATTENKIQTTTEQNNKPTQQECWNKLVMIKNNLNVSKCYQTQEQKDKAGRIYNGAIAGNRDFADKVKAEFEQILNYPVATAGTNNES